MASAMWASRPRASRFSGGWRFVGLGCWCWEEPLETLDDQLGPMGLFGEVDDDAAGSSGQCCGDAVEPVSEPFRCPAAGFVAGQGRAGPLRRHLPLGWGRRAPRHNSATTDRLTCEPDQPVWQVCGRVREWNPERRPRSADSLDKRRYTAEVRGEASDRTAGWRSAPRASGRVRL